MNGKNWAVIVAILILAAGVWSILGGVVLSYTAGAFSGGPDGESVGIWGSPIVQAEPVALSEFAPIAPSPTNSSAVLIPDRGPESANPVWPTPTISASGEAAIAQSRVTVDLHTELQDYKLRRYPVYTVDFTGKYTVCNNSSSSAQSYVVRFELPGNPYGCDRQGELSRQRVCVNGRALKEWTTEVRTPPLGPGESAEVEFGYRTTGLEQWTYALPNKRMVDDLTVTANINTADFTIPPFGAAPAERAAKPDAAGKYTLTWHKEKVSYGKNVVIVMPTALQPGHVAAKIVFFGPVSLFFFFVVLGTVQKVRKLPLGGLNYIFLAAAFFAGHLLLAAFLGHVGLGASFWIGAATSFLLVVMYMRLVLGRRAEVVWAGLGQAAYLIVVGYSFFVDGWAGLTMAVVAVGTLAVLMILTARSGAVAVEEGKP